MVHLPFSGVVLLATAIAAVTDARSGRIPNALTLPLIGLVPLAQFVANGLGGLLSSALGAALCALPPLVLFFRDAMGGGDLKLFAGIGAALGVSRGLELELTAYGVAALIALCLLVRQKRLAATLRGVFRRGPTLDGGLERAEVVRLGVPIFLAAVWCIGLRMVGR